MTEEEYYATCLDIVDEYLFKLEEGIKARDFCIIRHAFDGAMRFLSKEVERLKDEDIEAIRNRVLNCLMLMAKDKE